MEAITLKIALSLADVLIDIGDKVLLGGMIDSGKAVVKYKINSDIEKRKKAQKIQQALSAAREALNYDADYPLLKAASKLQGDYKSLNDLCQSVIVISALMTSETDDSHIPAVLLKQLDLASTDSKDLARFLWAFRTALREDALKDKDFIDLVDRAKEQEARDTLLQYLGTLTSAMGETAEGQKFHWVKEIPPDMRKIERPYLDRIISDYTYLPLTGRDRRASTTQGFQIGLAEVYTALRVGSPWTLGDFQPETLVPGSKRAEVYKQLRENADEEQTYKTHVIILRTALSCVLDRQNLLLLGLPGSGKSTFADHLVLCLAHARRSGDREWLNNHLATYDAEWDIEVPLVFRFRLRDFAKCIPDDAQDTGCDDDVITFIKRNLDTDKYGSDFYERAIDCINNGDALIVFDGLDEIGNEDLRTYIADAISHFAQSLTNTATRIVVTCRVRQYPFNEFGKPVNPWVLQGFTHVTLQDFDNEQIENFVSGWYRELSGKPDFKGNPEVKAASLIDAISNRPKLGEIAGRPLLLTQMALVHEHDGGELPRSRAELYEKCANLLLWEWEKLRAGRDQLLIEDYINDKLQIRVNIRSLTKALDQAVYESHEAQKMVRSESVDIPYSTIRRHVARVIQNTGVSPSTAKSKADDFIMDWLSERNALIVPGQGDDFQTPHRTFQEYLSARYLATQTDLYKTLPKSVVDNYALWNEVFLLTLARIREFRLPEAALAVHKLVDASSAPEESHWQRIILAGETLDELIVPEVLDLGDMGKQLIDLVQDRLKTIMQNTQVTDTNLPVSVPIDIRYQAGEVLDQLGWLPFDINDWVAIPYKYPLLIAKYPVTNAQYAEFINAGGYSDPTWWGGAESEAWQWRMEAHPDYRGEGPVTEPLFWNDVRFGKNRRGYPVVGVSWYEAQAYCVWKAEQLATEPKPVKIWVGKEDKPIERLIPWDTWQVRLPLEDEWIIAAGGEKDDRYPWGDWDASKANTSESSLGGTSPVAMYPAGRSPHGVMDMCGNVWEWMLDDAGKGIQALRGGSWDNNRENARVSSRLGGDRFNSLNLIGFRLVLAPNSSGY